jgi:hypothetical protein
VAEQEAAKKALQKNSWQELKKNKNNNLSK